MAEAATAIQLVQFTAFVLGCCYEYISKAKNAPKEIQRAIDEISSLKSTLENLKPLAENKADWRFSFVESLNAPGGPFQACHDALTELGQTLKALTELSSLRQRLQWPIEAPKIEAIVNGLSGYKTTFILAIAGDNRRSTMNIERVVTEVQSSVDDMKVKQQREQILAWLSGVDPSINHSAAQKKRASGTCEWLIRSKQFEAFTQGTNQLMWMHGIPGAGKTVLTASVIDHLTAGSLPGEWGVIYFYFDFTDTAKQTCLQFLKSLVWQVCSSLDQIPKYLLDAHTACKGATPDTEQLTSLLRQLLETMPSTFIVVDALDECSEDDENSERTGVLEALKEIKSSTKGTFNIFVASRPEADIKLEMDEMCDIDLKIQAASVDEDIRLHVCSCLEKDKKLRRWPKDVKKEIEDRLTSDANGMFRWVICQLDVLRKCSKLSSIRNELKNLPESLEATYSRILAKVPTAHFNETKLLLMLLAFATRPMTLQEVAEATAVNLEMQHFSVDDRFLDAYDLLEFCSSLVTLSEFINSPKSPFFKEGIYQHGAVPPDIRVIQFAHFSVKEYLLSELTRKTIPAPLQINETQSHNSIAQACLIYLLDFSEGKRVSHFNHDKFPFLAYASRHWPTHAAFKADQGLFEALIMRLFDPEDDTALMNYLNLYDPRRHHASFRVPIPKIAQNRHRRDFAPPIYYACLHGLRPVLDFMLSKNQKSNLSSEALGIGLAAAASQGYEDLVEILLKEGADPNSPYCQSFIHPMHAAASGGNANIVRRLIEAGSQTNVYGGSEGSALHIAIQNDHSEVMQILVDAGHELYVWGEYNGPPLSAALISEKFDAVRLLVRNNINTNDPPEGYFNPLSLACSHASIEIVQLLLDNGADVAIKQPGNNCLQNAAKRGELEIMKLLLARGANIIGETRDFYSTPLKAAIQSRNPKVLEFVIQSGADINAKGSSSKYPIDLAIFGGNLSAAERLIGLGGKFGDEGLEEALDSERKRYLAKMLLDRGANPNAEHERYGSMLQFAAYKSSSTALQWLLEAGADPNGLMGGEFGTPLQAAAYRGNEDMVRLLLEHGAAVNPHRAAGRWGFPLQAAIAEKKASIFNLLLAHGALVNAFGGEYGTPLQAAACSGQIDFVQRLVELGAEINSSPGGKHGTALRAALAVNEEKIVEYLLKNKANIDIDCVAQHTTTGNKGFLENYESALEVAASSNNPRLVQLLLDHGLDLSADGRACTRALSRATQMMNSTMLEYLISKGVNVRVYGGEALVEGPNRRHPKLLQMAQILLKHGLNVNGPPGIKQTPLGCSIANEQWEVMDLLLDAGSDVNIAYPDGEGSALHEAIQHSSIDVVKKLLAKGADINIRAGRWGTPLAIAVNKGDEEIIRLLLENGAEVEPKPPHGHYGNALHPAISRGYYEIAYDLLDRGADPHSTGMHGNSLTTACGSGKDGQIDLIKRLLSLGVDLETEDAPLKEGDVFYRMAISMTPLQNAVSFNNLRVVELLLERGAKINPEVPKGTYGYPLQTAVRYGGESMVKFLLEKGADVNALGGEYGTALNAALDKNSDSLIKLLLDAGADVSLQGGSHGNPLQNVSRYNQTRHIELFLDRGAPINADFGKPGSALAAAAKRAALKAVELLISRGANVNQRGGKYGTPLQAACCARSQDKETASAIIKALLDAGADVNADGIGKYGTALQAAAYHNSRYVEILLEKGADPNSRGGKYGSPLKAAYKKELGGIVNMLLKHGAVDEEAGTHS